MKVPVTCIECGEWANATRCPTCERQFQAVRNAKPSRQAYRDITYRSIPRGGKCWICGEDGADTIDHVIPLAKGGSNDPSNLKPAHRSCNSSRGGS